MMFFKKLCRITGNAVERQQNIGTAPTTSEGGGIFQGASSLEASTTRQRFASLNGDSNRNSNNNNNTSADNSQQFANRSLLCRTPPPVYNCLPATPPPSYTPRIERAAGGGGGASDEQGDIYAQVLTTGAERRQLAHQCENATNRNVLTAHNASLPQQQQQQQQQQQRRQQRRRRRLHLLQQQRLSNINASSTSSTSTASSSSSNSSSNSNSESESNNAASNAVRRHGPLHSRCGIRDAYCPDLLHACSLILHQQQQPSSDDSSVSSFTATPPPAASCYSSTDYVEIDQVRPLGTRQRATAARRKDSLTNWSSTPELSTRQPHCTQSSVATGLNNQRSSEIQEMGQNLSLRRPRISLTWVLREQQQQQQQQQGTADQQQNDEKPTTNGTIASIVPQNNNNAYLDGGAELKQRTELVPTQLDTSAPATVNSNTKRYRVKQLPGSNDPLNGYATTPTAHTAANVLAPQKFFSNQNLLDYRDKSRAPSRELLFVCTPQRLPKSYDTNEALVLAKKRNEIRKKLAAKMAALQAQARTGDGAEASGTSASNPSAVKVISNGGVTNNAPIEKEELKSLKGTYSEPSLVAASEGQAHRRHRHRKRRDRNRGQKFGYEISNVDEFLSKCSLASPGNIPVVLSTSSTLYQTRPGQHQIEIPLPLGMVVNAVFKNQNWLYVQTPHAEEGYVGYSCCLPLGILPPAARGNQASSKPTPCWESNGDVFPRPCGNMTDSEKEIRLRGGTRSDGARTPRGKRSDPPANGTDVDTVNGNAATQLGEHHVDKLYLRAVSQPRLVEKAYAQLRSTKNATQRTANDEYVTLQQQKSKLHVQKHLQQQQQLQQMHHKQLANGPYITNGHNGQHLHPQGVNVNANQQAGSQASGSQTHSNANLHQSVLHMVSRKHHGLRQTLVAINTNYSTESITLQKGEIVTLCECRESKDHRQWFYVKTRDGREGYIPAEVAGHGYL